MQQNSGISDLGDFIARNIAISRYNYNASFERRRHEKITERVTWISFLALGLLFSVLKFHSQIIGGWLRIDLKYFLDQYELIAMISFMVLCTLIIPILRNRRSDYYIVRNFNSDTVALAKARGVPIVAEARQPLPFGDITEADYQNMRTDYYHAVQAFNGLNVLFCLCLFVFLHFLLPDWELPKRIFPDNALGYLVTSFGSFAAVFVVPFGVYFTINKLLRVTRPRFRDFDH